jgi:oxalate decarboxylase/phosphoglucose isomerase-like protein (cupin superfamily)
MSMDQKNFEADIRPSYQNNKPLYDQWVEAQNIPVIREFYIEDLRTVALKPWASKGGNGAILNLIGTGDVNDGYISEIPRGQSLRPQRVMYEELIFVLEGHGSTSVWNDDGKKVTFEWAPGSLFSPPLNTWRQHFNGSGNKPARFLGVTSAPPLMNLFRDLDFIFNTPFSFKDRFNAADPESFSGKGKTWMARNRPVWESNFIPDVRALEVFAWKERGGGGANIMIELSENCMSAHISEFPVGTYKKAHRHGAGAHVVIIGGEGYSLMWPEGEQPKRFDWRDGSVVVPPEDWFHQHFNTGATPARYLALKARGRKHTRPWGSKVYAVDEGTEDGGDQIEYEYEDPSIRRMFEEALAKNGVTCRMAPVVTKKSA